MTNVISINIITEWADEREFVGDDYELLTDKLIDFCEANRLMCGISFDRQMDYGKTESGVSSAQGMTVVFGDD